MAKNRVESLESKAKKLDGQLESTRGALAKEKAKFATPAVKAMLDALFKVDEPSTSTRFKLDREFQLVGSIQTPYGTNEAEHMDIVGALDAIFNEAGIKVKQAFTPGNMDPNSGQFDYEPQDTPMETTFSIGNQPALGEKLSNALTMSRALEVEAKKGPKGAAAQIKAIGEQVRREFPINARARAS